MRKDGAIKVKDQVSRFHTNQAIYILFVFIVLVSAFFIMLAKQYRLAQSHEKNILLGNFQEKVSHIDSLLARVTEHVEGMRIFAEADLLQSRGNKTLNQSLEFESITEVVDEKRFHLDTFTPVITLEMIGNLTGQGSINDRNRDFYREIHMALSLNPMFRAAAEIIKNAAWIYYTSQNNFINIYPWISSGDFRFSKELYTHEFFSLGLPQNNPERKRFWTKVYVDEYGKGLMTTCAMPVYDNDRFMGTVSIDLTVDFLNTVVKKFNPKQGIMFLVNDKDQLLAHPSLISSEDKTTKSLKEVLPEAIQDSVDLLTKIPDNKIFSIDSFNIIRSNLQQAPWQVIYIEQKGTFWNSFIDMIGIGSVTILVMLMILLIIVFAITHSQFILPSKKFVNYIMDRSQKISTQMDFKIPHVWRPWFNAIEKVFSENEKLAQELQEQNANLELRVKQRTTELEKEIEERKQIQETLRKSEERFRDISYSMADFIWEIDSNGIYTFTSETVKQILGYDANELIGITPFKLMPEEEATRIKGIFNKIIANKKPLVDLENWNLSKQGKRVCLLTNGVPILDDSGGLIGYRGVDKDITDRKQAEKEQFELQSRLQRVEKMESIGALAGGVAHDLNNILSGLVGYPDLLLLQIPVESPLRKPIETIKETGLKAAAVVQDLLTLARRGVAISETLNLNNIITEYLNSPEYWKLISLHQEFKLNLNLENNLLNITGSPVHISKTIMNLVSNAVEAMPNGGEINISTENKYIDVPIRGYDEVKEGDYVVFKVSDTGVGISPEDREKIFEPFYTKKVMGRSGTGLGMAVVWGTIKDHNGYIDIESKEGKGTTFILYFPITREHLTKKDPQFSIDEYKGNGESILIVDDVREQREIAMAMLTHLCYKVSVVSSGEQAVEYLKKKKVDLVVLDMIMDPGIDGLDTYKLILEISPGQKTILSSGFSETARVKEAQRLGADKYIKKPYSLETLGIAVNEALN